MLHHKPFVYTITRLYFYSIQIFMFPLGPHSEPHYGFYVLKDPILFRVRHELVLCELESVRDRVFVLCQGSAVYSLYFDI